MGLQKWSIIEEKIKEYWSPEQITNRPTDKIDKVPSTSSIYRMIQLSKIGKVKKSKNVSKACEKESIKSQKACKDALMMLDRR